MTRLGQTATLDWRSGGIPVSTRFDDPYFSLGGGLAETQHVFLAGNDLPNRLRAGFAVAELGFGTGLNLLALATLCPPGLPLTYTSFEAYPMAVDDMARALAHFPPLGTLAPALLHPWGAGLRQFSIGTIAVNIVMGDAGESLPHWGGRADAWFLDGFSPAKNPDMWSPAILAQVAQHTARGGTFATYTAAGHVRRALGEAGFAVQRVAGYGHKRHMSKGILRDI